MKRIVLACLASVAMLAGCDDDDNVTNPGGGTGGTGATPSPSPSASPGTGDCTQTSIASPSRTLSRNTLDFVPFTTASAGRVDVTVSFTGNANVGAFLVEGNSCTQTQFNNGNCPFLASSDDSTPRTLSATLPAGNYELVLNYFGGGGTDSQDVDAEIVLNTGNNCPAFPSPSPSPTASPSPSPSPTATP